MYYVAKVNSEMCSTHKCNMCTLYCPEANTLMYDKEPKHGNSNGHLGLMKTDVKDAQFVYMFVQTYSREIVLKW